MIVTILTLCAVIFTMRLCIICISPYRTLAVVELQSMAVATWPWEKVQTLFIFRAIWENTAHVKLARCLPKSSQLIHWTSAVFSHIALKWTPFVLPWGAFLVRYFPNFSWPNSCRLRKWKKLVDFPRLTPSLTSIGRIRALSSTCLISRILICKWAISERE